MINLNLALNIATVGYNKTLRDFYSSLTVTNGYVSIKELRVFIES